MQDWQQRAVTPVVAIQDQGQCVARLHDLHVRRMIGFVK
jgi:hypothetical protein